MAGASRWFRFRPLTSIFRRRRRRDEQELDALVRRGALAATAAPGHRPVPAPAARLITLLPRVRSITVRWDDLDGRPVCRGTATD